MWYTVLSAAVTILPHHNRQLAIPEYHFALRSRRREVVSFVFSLTSRVFPLLHRIRLGKITDDPPLT